MGSAQRKERKRSGAAFDRTPKTATVTYKTRHERQATARRTREIEAAAMAVAVTLATGRWPLR